ncbi:hypothetical protein LguiA_022213 [Lonicera macranthoides]
MLYPTFGKMPLSERTMLFDYLSVQGDAPIPVEFIHRPDQWQWLCNHFKAEDFQAAVQSARTVEVEKMTADLPPIDEASNGTSPASAPALRERAERERERVDFERKFQAQIEYVIRAAGIQPPIPPSDGSSPYEKRKSNCVNCMWKLVQTRGLSNPPGAIYDLEKLNEIKNSQDEGSKDSLETNALTQYLGKDKRSRTRGVSSTVPRTKLKATIPIRNELQKGQKASTNTHESGGSHNHVVYSEKSFATHSPSTPSSGAPMYYKLMSAIDGRKVIAIAITEKTTDGAIVHNRTILPHEAKFNVIKVYSGMQNEPLWQGTQCGANTITETEVGYVVWPKHLTEEVGGRFNINDSKIA